MNATMTRNVRSIEMVGVLLRIFCFSIFSWLGPQSPFLFIWTINTFVAIVLSWCSIIKKDRAYTIMNLFWIGVGVIGILRASEFAN